MIPTVISIGLFINAFTNVPTYVADGLGKPKISGLAAISTAVLNLSLVIPLTHYFGIMGTAMAFLISDIAVFPFFLYYVHRIMLGLKIKDLIVQAYLRPLAAFLFVGFIVYQIPHNNLNNLFLVGCAIAGTTLLYLLVCLVIKAVPDDDRDTVLSYLKILIRGRVPASR
jgi:O-antigen/teichoic acid export membrane protein